MTDLARTFNESDEAEGRRRAACSSGRRARRRARRPPLLATGLGRERRRPAPGDLVAGVERVGRDPQPAAGRRGPAGRWRPTAEPFMQTPLVIAMPKPMADALGYPEKPVGWADILAPGASDAEGWAAYGHPEWGPFRLGKTNPNFSTSGLSALIAQTYAATGKTTRPVVGGPRQPRAPRRSPPASSRPSSTTATPRCTFLNNWYRTDREGTSLTYVSAVAVEEKSVIDYNAGNPDGVLDPGEQPRKPRIPLVADLPEGGHALLGQPVLRARRRLGERRASARRPSRFEDFVQRPENQRKVLRVRLPAGQPRRRRRRADRRRPTASTPTSRRRCSRSPAPRCMIDLLDKWAEQRKSARVLVVLDVSGSMGDVADQDDRRDQARPRQAGGHRRARPVQGRGRGRPAHLHHRTTTADRHRDPRPRARSSRSGRTRSACAARSATRCPLNGTPLYEVTRTSFEEVLDSYDPDRINAVVAAHRRRSRTTASPTTTRTSCRRCSSVLRVRRRARPASRCASSRSPTATEADLDVLRHDRRGDQLGVVRRQRPEDDQQGLHRGRVQLLTRGQAQLPRPVLHARRWRGPSPSPVGHPRRRGPRPRSASLAVRARSALAGRARRRAPARVGARPSPADERGPNIDPFAREGAVAAASCSDALAGPPALRRGDRRHGEAGPLRDRLTEIGGRLDTGVEEVLEDRASGARAWPTPAGG